MRSEEKRKHFGRSTLLPNGFGFRINTTHRLGSKAVQACARVCTLAHVHTGTVPAQGTETIRWSLSQCFDTTWYMERINLPTQTCGVVSLCGCLLHYSGYLATATFGSREGDAGPVRLPLWSRMKHLNTCWMDGRNILETCMVPPRRWIDSHVSDLQTLPVVPWRGWRIQLCVRRLNDLWIALPWNLIQPPVSLEIPSLLM